MKAKAELEKEIMKTVRQSPLKPAELAEKVGHDSKKRATEAREAIRSLVDKGTLQVTLDWKVQASK